MPKEQEKKKMGRPKFQIDYDLVNKLAHIQCTQEEIASIVGCDVRTLQRDEEFCRIYKTASETGKSSLRRLQWKSAEKGNVTMQIWLGKQYLGQKDVIENKADMSNGILTELVGALNNAKNNK